MASGEKFKWSFSSHTSSRALKAHELITTIFAKFFLSPYISLHENAAILTVLRTRVCY